MKSILFFIFCLLAIAHYGQQINFTQYTLVPAKFNPSWITLDNNIRGTLLYHHEANGDFYWNSTVLAGSLPLLVKNKMPKAGIMLSFLDDRSANGVSQYLQNNLTTGFSYSIWTTKNSYLMAGIGSGINMKKFGDNNNTTGAQYVPGVGFDASLPNQETGLVLRKYVIQMLTGITYLVKDSLKNNRFIISAATNNNVKHLYLKGLEEKYHLSTHIYSHYKFLMTCKRWYYLDAMYQSSHRINQLNIGAGITFLLSAGKFLNTVDLIIRLNSKGVAAGIATVEFKSLVFGFSYQSAVMAKENHRYPAITEFSLIYKNPVKGKKKRLKDRHARKPATKTNTSFTLPKPVNQDTIIPARGKDSRPKVFLKPDSLKSDSAPKMPKDLPISDPDKSLLKGRLLVAKQGNKILFEKNSLVLSKESQLVIDSLYNILTSAPKLKLIIIGHTDDVGNAASNLKLSKARALAVRQYLFSKGQLKNQVNAQGAGEERPLVPNADDLSRSINRRVEMILYK